MPKRNDVDKVLLIGSGPIQIGQAAEFDYSGSQACRGLREEGVEVVLVNSNPATIMTDPDTADAVYIEPLTLDSLARIIDRERPDGVAAGLGGQTGLNLTAELDEAGVLGKYDVEVLGTSIKTIHESEDRKKFKQFMQGIGEEVAESIPVTTVREAKSAVEDLGYPVIIRPAYTLGGAGGGAVNDESELEETVSRGLKLSRISQVLVEESVEGWKEFEYEVMRDASDTCITVVNMENIDPMGIHTGESMVVAPSQTLSDVDHQKLRSAAIRIIRALGVEGGCNIQFALNSETGEYKVVEVNPRVSRSSALASKATGYPIARVAGKIAIGMDLLEIPNDVTGRTPASFEPTVDYVVVKIPRWPFEKFYGVERELSTQMKSTGEVMAIGRNVEEALHKAVRSLDIGVEGLSERGRPGFESKDELVSYLKRPTDRRKFALFDAVASGMKVEEISSYTGMDPFWIEKFRNIYSTRERLAADWKKWLKRAKNLGFSTTEISEIAGVSPEDVKKEEEEKLRRDYKMVDTCAGEFKAETPYYYSTYESMETTKGSGLLENKSGRKVLVLGSGPIRIGQGIEFDYGCVHALSALREEGIETLTLNNNPETVSTDFDASDKLYFDPLTLDDVMNVIEKEKPDGVIVQFGGQTSVNLAVPLQERLERRSDLPTEIYGTDPKMMDAAEDRDLFSLKLNDLGIPQPENGIASSKDEALDLAQQIGYPVLVRPSYVLGGREMEIVYGAGEMKNYLSTSGEIRSERGILVDKYLEDSVEVDVDAVSDGKEVLIGGIMEHIEEAGVHSGDSACVTPPQTISNRTVNTVKKYVINIARELDVVGLLNVQLAVKNEKVYLLEANPRSSRTIPYLSKATGVPLAGIAAKVMAGRSLDEMGYTENPRPSKVAVKEVVSPFANLPGVDPVLGPEMQSTGEVMGIGDDFNEAYYKAEIAAENEIPTAGTVLVSVKDEDKTAILPLVEDMVSLGLNMVATEGTGDFLENNGIAVDRVNKVSSGSPDIIDFIRSGDIDLIINTPTKGRIPHRDGFKIRRAAVDLNVPYITNLNAARAAVNAVKNVSKDDLGVRRITEYQAEKWVVKGS